MVCSHVQEGRFISGDGRDFRFLSENCRLTACISETYLSFRLVLATKWEIKVQENVHFYAKNEVEELSVS